MSAYAEYHASAHKLLSDNRAVYIAMSELHKNGKRPTYSEAEQYALSTKMEIDDAKNRYREV